MTETSKDTSPLRTFLKHMRDAGHRPETVAFVGRVAGQEIDRFQFVVAYREAVKVRATPCKAKGLFDYLVRCNIIRSNER